jgi:hypothetical protein
MLSSGSGQWLQFYEAATIPYARPATLCGPLRQKRFLFYSEIACRERERALPKRGKVHSIIRTAYLQAPVLCEFVPVYFWRGGLFRNDKDAHSLVELGAPFSVRGGIVRR